MSHKVWSGSKQSRSQRIIKRLLPHESSCGVEFLLPLRVGEEVSLSGTLEVRVLRGCAEIWGASLLPSKRFRRLGGSPLVFHASDTGRAWQIFGFSTGRCVCRGAGCARLLGRSPMACRPVPKTLQRVAGHTERRTCCSANAGCAHVSFRSSTFDGSPRMAEHTAALPGRVRPLLQ